MNRRVSRREIGGFLVVCVLLVPPSIWYVYRIWEGAQGSDFNASAAATYIVAVELIVIFLGIVAFARASDPGSSLALAPITERQIVSGTGRLKLFLGNVLIILAGLLLGVYSAWGSGRLMASAILILGKRFSLTIIFCIVIASILEKAIFLPTRKRFESNPKLLRLHAFLFKLIVCLFSSLAAYNLYFSLTAFGIR